MQHKFPSTEALLQTNPFSTKTEDKELFVASYREMALHHMTNCKELGLLWKDAGFSPTNIKSEADLANAPYLMIHLLKEHELCSCNEKDLELILTSSGTGGQKSQQRLDAWSLANVKKLARAVYEGVGLTSQVDTNYVCFTYDPQVAKDLGTAFSDEVITSFATKNEVFYTFQWSENKNDFEFEKNETMQKIIAYAEQNHPLRLLGFPAFMYEILRDNKINVKAKPNSFILSGGGWKTHADKEISKGEFQKLINKHLGIPASNIRDSYGLVEHGIPYVDCERGHFHIPNYARVFIRDPRTLEILPSGKKGLIQLLCTYNSSYPCLNILTTDYGMLETCDCALGGSTLKILGRAGMQKHKGCAINALSVQQRS